VEGTATTWGKKKEKKREEETKAYHASPLVFFIPQKKYHNRGGRGQREEKKKKKTQRFRKRSLSSLFSIIADLPFTPLGRGGDKQKARGKKGREKRGGGRERKHERRSHLPIIVLLKRTGTSREEGEGERSLRPPTLYIRGGEGKGGREKGGRKKRGKREREHSAHPSS